MKKTLTYSISIIALIAVIVSCSFVLKHNISSGINENDLKEWIAKIASDEFQGRFPGTEGEEKTANYLVEQFAKVGAKPGNGDSFFQEVPLIKITNDQKIKLNVKGDKGNISFEYLKDIIGGTPQPVEKINLSNLDMVYVGFGINAPEFGWNDYAGADVKGKIVLALVNDPGFYDSTLFKGKNMTYYGRWIYKYEEAARQGAAGIILIHETEAASYPWSVVQNSWALSRFYLANNIVTNSGLQFQSWIENEAAHKLLGLSDLFYDAAIANASKRGFTAIPLKLKTDISFINEVNRINSKNIVALIPGSEHPEEVIIYTAHWDHFGINPNFKGDSILNGALDNATGTAGLIAIAKAFSNQKEKPKRSILLMATTCEEQGLLGSQYYTENPLYPLNKTIAVINMDVLNVFGKTKDMNISGYGLSELDGYAIEAVKNHNRFVKFERNSTGGGYYRSDHFSFSKVGVPTINLTSGSDFIDTSKLDVINANQRKVYGTYHKPSDNYDPTIWVFDGMVDDLTVYFELGYMLSQSNKYPNWYEGVVYKAKRDEMMK